MAICCAGSSSIWLLGEAFRVVHLEIGPQADLGGDTTAECGPDEPFLHAFLLAGSYILRIYLFINGITPKTSTPMSQLYDQFRQADGFLYIRRVQK